MGDDDAADGLVRRTGRQATDTRHITMALLEEGGYFDMPLKVREVEDPGLRHVRTQVATHLGRRSQPFTCGGIRPLGSAQHGRKSSSAL